MSVLALDPGGTCGWALHRAGRITFGSFSVTAKDDYKAQRYRRFRMKLADVIPEGCRAVWYEHVAAHRGTAAAHWWGGWEALILLACDSRSIPCHAVAVATIKRHATGNGAAPKNAMIDAARRIVGDVELTHDEADALMLLDYAIHQSDDTGGDSPRTQQGMAEEEIGDSGASCGAET